VKIQAILLKSLTGHQGAIYALEPGPEPGMVFSGGADCVITAWDLFTRKNIPFLAHLPNPVYSLCFIREQNLLLAGTSIGNIHIIDLEKKQEIKVLKNHLSQVFSIRYSAKHNSFYTLGADGRFAVCDLATRSARKIQRLSNSKLRQLDLNVQQTELAIATGDGDIILLDAITLAQTNRFKAHTLSVNAVRYHPQGKLILTGGKDAHLNGWALEDSASPRFSIPAHNFSIYSIQFSPDHKLYATSSRDKTIKIWDASTNEFLLRINKEIHEGHVNSVNALYWSDDPACLVSAGDDRSLMVWEIRS